MNFKSKQRKKSTHAAFQNILKVALFKLKKEPSNLLAHYVLKIGNNWLYKGYWHGKVFWKICEKNFFPAEFFFSLPGTPETSVYFFVALNTNLFIFGKTDTIICYVCNIEHETTLHLLANCTKTNIFWANIKRVFQ